MPPPGIIACLLLVLCATGPGRAQVMSAPPPGAAPPDTAILVLDVSTDLPAPVLRSAGPDSVLFGGEIAVLCDFPAGVGRAALDSLVSRVPWAEPLGVEVSAAGPDEGVAATVTLRLSRAGPYRLAWGDGSPSAQIFHVTGRLGPDDPPAPLRDPRRLGWYWWRLLLVLLAAAVLLALIRRLRGRDEADAVCSDPLPPPAWMPAAVALCDLADGGRDARGEGRVFLDELGLIYRRYLAGRFRIGAVEMTPEEIARTLASHRYPERVHARARDILSRCDLLRFSPGEVPVSVCREQLRDVFTEVAQTRVQARYSPVPPDLELAAGRSWNRLLEIVPTAEGGGRV